MKFGQTAAEYVETRANESDEVWIRAFRDPQTRIRVLPIPTDEWVTMREHYEEGIGYYPCSEKRNCIGCSNPSERVRKRSRKFYGQCLDEKGMLRIFKFGSDLFMLMKAREQRYGTLSDRDYIINKYGQKLETRYDPEQAEKYDIDFPDPSEWHDVDQVLYDRYMGVVAELTGNAEEATSPMEPRPSTTEEERPASPTGRIIPASALERPEQKDEPAPVTRISPIKPASKATEAKPEPEPEEPGWQSWDDKPDKDTIESATTADIKGWLSNKNVEFPSKAPRSRLVNIALEAAELPPY